MTLPTRPSIPTHIALALHILATLVVSCQRNVTVHDVEQIQQAHCCSPVPTGVAGTTPVVPSTAGTPTAQADSGVVANMGVGGSDSAGNAAPPTPKFGDLRDGIDQAQPMVATQLRDFEVLTDPLNTTAERPAVGTEGASLLQFRKSSSVEILHVTYAGAVDTWYASSGAYDGYTAAYGGSHVSLLYAAAYGIYENGGNTELSGTPNTYKEFLAASAAGITWVDYPNPTPFTFPGLPMTYGTVVLRSWAGTRSALTDNFRYRAHVALSATHVAFVEYATTTPGSIGQIVVQALAGGTPLTAAPGINHQDRPVIDGDWVVFEEYVSSQDAVIRARNLVTGEVRDLSARTGFRGNADLHASRVVWEDYRSGGADIYDADLGFGTEQALITGPGNSMAPRLLDDGLVWIESNGSNGLMRARWNAPP